MSYTVRNLVIAAALALVGMILVGSYLKTQQQKLERGNEYVKVLVADKDIPSGTKASSLVSDDYVRTERILKKDQQPQALDSLKAVDELSTSRTIFVGDQMTARSFAKTSNLEVADSIKGTERVFSVPAGPYQAVAKHIRPGDRIDIMATDGKVTWYAARDVLVIETPETRVAEGSEEEVDPKVNAGADPEVFVVQASDKVARDIMHTLGMADGTGLSFQLRPGDGAQDTTLKPYGGYPKND